VLVQDQSCRSSYEEWIQAQLLTRSITTGSEACVVRKASGNVSQHSTLHKKAALLILAVRYGKMEKVAFLRGCLLNITRFSTTKKGFVNQ